MYQGALPQMTATQELTMVPLAGVAAQAGQESVNRLAQTVDAAEAAFEHIKDYGTAKAADKRASEATGWYDGEVKRRASLESGHPESLWNEDGTLKQEDLAELKRQYEEKLKDIQPRFMDSRRGFETHQQLRDLMDKTSERNEAYVHGLELSRARKNWEEDWELAAAKGEYGNAVRLLGEGVRNGVLSEKKAELLKLRLLKMNARKAGSGAGAGQLSDKLVMAMRTRQAPQESSRAGDLMLRGEEDLKVHVEDASENDTDMRYDARENVMPEDDGGMGVRVAQPKEDEVDGSLLLRTDGSAVSVPQKIADMLNEDALQGIDTWKRPEVLMAGMDQLSFDEFVHLHRLDDIASGVMSVGKDRDGEMELLLNESAPEALQVCARSAVAKGGFSEDEYRTACYAVGAEIIDSDLYAGAKDKDLREYLEGSMRIDGMEEHLFADSDNPQLAYDAFVNEVVENLMSTRRDNVNARVDAMLNGKDGMPGLKDMLKGYDDASIAAMYQPSDQESALREAQDSFWQSKREATGRTYAQLFAKYKGQFMAENGLSDKEVTSAGSVIDEFRDWFFKKDGVYDGLVKDYVRSAKDFMRQKAVEAVVDYRRAGGSDWAGEQAAMEQALIQARDGLKGGGEWTAWREDRQRSLAARANKYRIDAEAYKPQLRAAQEAGAQEKADRDANAARAKWEAQQEKNALHKRWSEEVKEEERKKNPYRYPLVASVGVLPDSEGREVVTVPREQYHDICQQLDVSASEGVVCSFGNSNVTYCVQAGDVSAPQMSTKVFNRLYKGKKLSQDQMRKMVNGHHVQMKFKKLFNIQ